MQEKYTYQWQHLSRWPEPLEKSPIRKTEHITLGEVGGLCQWFKVQRRKGLPSKLKRGVMVALMVTPGATLAGGYTRSQWLSQSSRWSFTLSNLHEDLHGSCLAHPSLLVIQALQRPIWCSWLKIKWTKQKNKEKIRKSIGQDYMNMKCLKTTWKIRIHSLSQVFWMYGMLKAEKKQKNKQREMDPRNIAATCRLPASKCA